MKNNYLNIFFFFYLLSVPGFGQTYTTDFENYAAGQLLACQDSVNWNTFSLTPCDSIEDALVTTNYAHSGTNAVVILPDDDLIKPLGSQTSGKWHIGFDVLIPSDKAGYFNVLASFTPDPIEWAMEVYFADGGVGNIYGGSGSPVSFAFPYDEWFPVEVIVDLDLDSGELRINNTTIHNWQWTLGSNGGGCSLMLAVVDFFGAYPNNEMYIDNFWFGDYPVSIKTKNDLPTEFSLSQNYPNPFNPTTKIKFTIPSTPLSFGEGLGVRLIVYDVLGNEIATLVNEEKPAGEYEVEFSRNLINQVLPSGIYFYQLKAGNFIETKKMVLLK